MTLLRALVFGIAATVIAACGSSFDDASGGHDASLADGGTAPVGDASTMAGDATVSHDAGETDDGGMVIGGDDASMGDDGSAGGDASTSDAGSCMPATFATDCPAVACQTASGCTDNVCQYIPQTPCHPRTLSGTFIGGATDVSINGVTLHGGISGFRSDDGVVCVGTTCIGGSITP